MKQFAIITAVFGFLLSCSNEKKEVITTENETKTEAFSPNNLPSQAFSINPTRDTLLLCTKGTKVFIPKNSFITESGAEPKGPVTVEVKEALSLEDMVLGNLTTTSNGRILQSGGMFSITASEDGKELLLKNGSSLEAVVPANQVDDSMQVFSADINPDNGLINWVDPKPLLSFPKPEQKKDQTEEEPAPIAENFEFDTNDSTEAISKSYFITSDGSIMLENGEVLKLSEPPLKPKLHNPSDNRVIKISLDDYEDIDELAQFKDVKFRVSEASAFDPKDAGKTWIDVSIAKTSRNGEYKLKFKGLDNSKMIEREYLVSPVFEEGDDYEKAIAQYNNKVDDYEKKKIEFEKQKKMMNERIAAEAAERMRKEEERLKALKELERIRKNGLAKAPSYDAKYNTTWQNSGVDPAMNYYISITKLGWTNIDRFYHDPRCQLVKLMARINDYNNYQNVTVSMLFPYQRVYMPGIAESDNSFVIVKNGNVMLPVGESILYIARGYINGDLCFALIKRKIESTERINLALNAGTEPEFKLELQKHLN